MIATLVGCSTRRDARRRPAGAPERRAPGPRAPVGMRRVRPTLRPRRRATAQPSGWQYPFASPAGTRARLTGGSDRPPSAADPLEEIAAALNRVQPESAWEGVPAEPPAEPTAERLPETRACCSIVGSDVVFESGEA